MQRIAVFTIFVLSGIAAWTTPPLAASDLRILFLGDQGHHQPVERAKQIIPVMAQRGIQIEYTEDLNQLTDTNLSKFDGLLVYANIDSISEAQAAALLKYVADGGGFIPIHCASYCFRNSPQVVDLIGAQFASHGTAEFETEIVAPEHPVMRGFHGFRSWDETYIHARHNSRNRIVLEVRREGEQAIGRDAEPWTWIRHHGQGRVFYTAWGHDHRTWGHPGFHNLLERGIRWACGDDPARAGPYVDPNRFPIPQMTSLPEGPGPFEYIDVGPRIPNYLAGERWGTQGQPMTLMQKPLPPEESMQRMVTPTGFHLELFAAEPDFGGKPIAMNWDHRGRLWVCVTIDYPNELAPPGAGNDSIRILEDTDGDGRSDRSILFADHLSIPTSLEFAHGGVIVQSGIETIYLRDNDGDDRADERRVLVTGWAMGDTHGGVSNFQYGLDNRIWAMQGYNDSHPKYSGGQHPGFRQGPFAMTIGGTAGHPEVTDIEFIRSTTNNSWCLGISEEGLVFASTANRAPSFFIPIPNRYFERVRGWTPRLIAEPIAPDHIFRPITDKIRQVDHHGGYTAAAGHAIYTARSYPSHWWNRTAFVCGPTGHLVGTFVLRPRGSSFTSQYTFNLLASDDEWSAPIMAEVGPDGYVWVIDWYNYIVQHNPTPQGFETGKGNAYQSDLRDKQHGRVYRVVYDGSDAVTGANQAPVLDPSVPQSLISGLAHPNRLWRRHAQRLLVERGLADVVPALLTMIEDPTVDAVGNNPGAVHALWTLHGLGALKTSSGEVFQAVVAALRHPASGVRRNAALVLPPSPGASAAILDARLPEDAHPQVRLAALMALADMPPDEAVGQYLARYACKVIGTIDEHWQDALTCAAATHAEAFLLAALDCAQDNERLARMLKIIAEHQVRTDASPQLLERLLTGLRTAPPSIRIAVVEGVVSGWPRTKAIDRSPAIARSLQQLLQQAGTSELSWLLRLGRQLESPEVESYAGRLAATLLSTIADEEIELDRRITATEELLGLLGDDSKVVASVADLISPQLPPTLASAIVRGLGTATAQNVSDALLDCWEQATPNLRSQIITSLMARAMTTGALLDAIESGKLGVEDIELSQRQALLTHPNRDLRERAEAVFQRQGARIDSNRQAVIDKYLIAARTEGNATAGQTVFSKNCASCHRFKELGQQIGPDLTGMSVHPKSELLVHILDPNRSVEGNFRRYTVLTADGQVLTGMLAAESLTSIEVIDAQAVRHAISREEIEELRSSKQSLMPEGFEQQISVEEMRDLLEFLTAKGKYVALPLAEVATAVSTTGLFHEGDDGPDRIVLPAWGPREVHGVPFLLVDPQGKTKPNIILLHGPRGTLPPTMPRSVKLPVNSHVRRLHMLGGISGWGYPAHREKSTSLIVRFHYADGTTEDHPLLNSVHFADYIRRVDVPGSEFAFFAQGQQVRYLSVAPHRTEMTVREVELIKGDDPTAPIVLAMTIER
ncbi:MAG: glycosyl hydrolase [Planctomycetota bacterium]|nr:MAG: glycosyl hydrolase [Planctomycetota bacterium]